MIQKNQPEWHFPAQSENRFSDLVLLQGTIHNKAFIAPDTCEKKQKQAETDGKLSCAHNKRINHPTIQQWNNCRKKAMLVYGGQKSDRLDSIFLDGHNKKHKPLRAKPLNKIY